MIENPAPPWFHVPVAKQRHLERLEKAAEEALRRRNHGTLATPTGRSTLHTPLTPSNRNENQNSFGSVDMSSPVILSKPPENRKSVAR